MNTNTNISETQEYFQFFSEIKSRIRSAQYEAMKAVNKEMIALYWELGRRIYEQQNQLGWGRSVVENLSRDIQKEFPGMQGFGARNIWYMAQFYSEYHSDARRCPKRMPSFLLCGQFTI
ncbi:MAG: DUF1016 N-terminal domain-containing protein, partial [Parabacteroides sp.]|nr:DUF1016 N-terminal domain-containing protein [Parabacteroides sp.]